MNIFSNPSPPSKFKMSYVLLLLLVPLLTTIVDASSSAADISICRADSDQLGCSAWDTTTTTRKVCPVNLGSMLLQECYQETVTNRGACLDEPANETIMSWTAKPVLSSAYSLRSGNGPDTSQDVTEYQPDKWMTITLKITQRNKESVLLRSFMHHGVVTVVLQKMVTVLHLQNFVEVCHFLQ